MKNTKYKIQNTKYTDGFTLIELILVATIIVIISVLVLGNLSRYRTEQALRTESLAIVSIINDARSKTLASLDSSEYGVRVQNDSIISFVGSSYNSNDPNNAEHELLSVLEINNITISGGSDIIFERLTGETSNTGFFELEIATDNSISRTITISATGQVVLN